MAKAPPRDSQQIVIPHLIDDLGLTPYAFRLYVHLKRVCGDRGMYRDGQEELAERCHISQAQISRALKELIDAELIVTRRHKGRVEVRIVDVWERNRAHVEAKEARDAQ